MAAVELDPLFVKALKLLQSKAKDSGAQLKAMLDDVVAQRKGLKAPSQYGDHEKAGLSKTKSDTDLKRKDGEKRPHDKSTKDPFEPEIKRSKFEQLKQQKEKDAKEKEREKVKKEKERKEKEEAQRQKDKAEKERKEKELAATRLDPEVISDEEETSQQMDAGDFAIDLGIACVVCRQFDVSSGNQLVECQECHSLYHQECHKPTVTGQDVSDPRFVWYCSRCTKSFKKMMAQKPIKPSKPTLPLTSVIKEPTSIIAKTSKPESDAGSQAFRRMDPKAIVPPKDAANLTSSSKAMVGLAGLAANLTKPRGESKNSSSSSKKPSLEHKGESSKSSSKSENKSQQGSKQDNSAKHSSSSSSSKSDSRKSESSKSSSSSSSSSSNKDESRELKRSDSKSSKSDSSSRKEDKREKSDSSSGKSSKEEKRSEKSSSPKHSTSSNSNSPPMAAPVSPPEVVTGKSGSGSGSSSSSTTTSNNKQAVANLSMVTANKRIQMMKKKAQAQTNPKEKRVHIK